MLGAVKRRPLWQSRLALAVAGGLLGLSLYELWDPGGTWTGAADQAALRVSVVAASAAAGASLALGLVHRYLAAAASGAITVVALFVLDAVRSRAEEGGGVVSAAALAVFVLGVALTAAWLRPELKKLRA